MVEIDGLTNAEYLVLGPLEGDTPRPLWEIAEDFVVCVVGEPPTRDQVADLLGPALVSLAAYGLVEVRRFVDWPASWGEGAPVSADRLVDQSRRPGAWSRHPMPFEVLAVDITEAGVGWL